MATGNGANGKHSPMKAWERRMMKEHGWFMHYVLDNPELVPPAGLNAHTHGLMITHEHPDLQIVYPVEDKVAHGIMRAIINLIKDDKVTIRPGVRYDKILFEYQVEFALARESGRRVLRAILPDKDNETSRESISPPFDVQWEGAEE